MEKIILGIDPGTFLILFRYGVVRNDVLIEYFCTSNKYIEKLQILWQKLLTSVS